VSFYENGRCPTCAKFAARLRRATTLAEQGPIQRAQEDHIEMVKPWRATQNMYNVMSELSTEKGNVVTADASIVKMQR